eukprot:1159321-Pelagomonas_calceolata.AAC.12
MSPSLKGLSSSHPPYHYVVLGGVNFSPQTLEPLKELGLDTHTATKLALKLHAHSVQYAYKLASAKRALDRLIFTLITKIRHGQLLVTSRSPLTSFLFLLVDGIHGASALA